jgi:hypothetical protein
MLSCGLDIPGQYIPMAGNADSKTNTVLSHWIASYAFRSFFLQ